MVDTELPDIITQVKKEEEEKKNEELSTKTTEEGKPKNYILVFNRFHLYSLQHIF